MFNLDTVLRACRDISTADINKARMATPQVASILLKVIADWTADQTIYDLKFVELALKTLLHLTFVTLDNEALTAENGFLPESYGVAAILQSFLAIAKELEASGDAVVNATALLSRMKGTDIKGVISTSHSSRHLLPSLALSNKKHIMISYCWNEKANPHYVADLAFNLRDLGYDTWRDVEGSALVPRMSGYANTPFLSIRVLIATVHYMMRTLVAGTHSDDLQHSGLRPLSG